MKKQVKLNAKKMLGLRLADSGAKAGGKGGFEFPGGFLGAKGGGGGFQWPWF